MPVRRPPGLDGSGPAFRLEVLPKLGDHDEFHPPPQSAADALPVSRITDSIFIGSVKDLVDLSKLRALGITHILNVAKEVEMLTPKDFEERKRKQQQFLDQNRNSNNANTTTTTKNIQSSSPDSAVVLVAGTSNSSNNNNNDDSNPLKTLASPPPPQSSVDHDDTDASDVIANIVGGTSAGCSSSGSPNSGGGVRGGNNQDMRNTNRQSYQKVTSSGLSPGINQISQEDNDDLNILVAGNNNNEDDAAGSISSPPNDASAVLDDSTTSSSTGMTKQTSVIIDDAEHFRMKHIPLRDGVNKNTMEVIDTAVDYVANAVENEGGRVMVHCRRGISRSAAVVVAYLMERKKMKYDDALNLVKSQRAVVSLNLEFRMNLSARCEQRDQQEALQIKQINQTTTTTTTASSSSPTA